ncbi:MAG TPA: CPBP family intramembrane glutamic endopeptidase [Steroidobacteraceae bacterium]|nr:CPBP family intramembrane glutamic endopeptidase [Steroidobacteraceae bacterium]
MRAFAWFLLLIALSLAAMAALTYPAWLLLHPHFDFPFHRIGERIGMLAFLLGFLLVARRLRLADRASLGFGAPRRVFLRELGIGLGLGVLTMAAVAASMAALGLLDFRKAAGYGAGALAALIAKRLASGLAVALIEETALRGAMYTGIQRESGAVTAIVLTSLVYAWTHFLGSYHIPPSQVSASSGVALLHGTLRSFDHPLGVADAFLCLSAVGVVLALVRSITGNIAAGMGLHAGWVWVMLVVHGLSQPDRASPLAFLLSRHDGFTGWLVLGWTVVLGLGLSRFYVRRRGASRDASLRTSGSQGERPL